MYIFFDNTPRKAVKINTFRAPDDVCQKRKSCASALIPFKPKYSSCYFMIKGIISYSVAEYKCRISSYQSFTTWKKFS